METRTFRLSSYDISPSNNLADYYKQTVTTQYGTVADNRMSLTWNNVNLQQIVGDDFFNAYNRFTIRLVNQAWFGASTSDSGTAYSAQNYQDTFVNVYLKGLPFYPPAYNSPDGALVNTLDLGLLSITTGQTFGRTQNANSINRTFLKTSSASLSINIRSVTTEQPFSPADIPTNLWGHSVYHFEITGIPDVSNVSYVDLTNSSVLESGSQTIYTELTPTDTFNYTGSSRVNNVFVTSTASSISFAASRPSSIVYETDLTNILIATVGEINGVTPTGVVKFFKDSTFEEEVTTSTILDYGIYTMYARFTPDSSNYADSFTSTTLIVIQKSTVLSYSAQSSVVYGSGDSAVLNASSTVPGTVAYFYDAANTLPITTTIDVGSYTVYAVFTPTSTNYLSSTASSSFTVTQASSSLSYSTSDAITYGTTIAASLTATTAAAGTTNYYKDSGHTQLISPSDIFNAGTYTIYAVFSPSSSNYLPSNASATLTVAKAPTSISFPVIPSIVYETTLSDFIAGTVATNIDGSLSFNIDSASGTSLSSSSVLHVGTYTIYAKFTPTDTANYLIAESTIPISVTSLSTTIEYSSPLSASVVYSSVLTDVLATTVTPNVSGTVSYYYGTNTIITTSTSLNVGTYDIYAVFTPSTADYASSTTVTPVTLTVTQATPTIIYANLSSIAYETPLSSSLIATSPVAGSFEYFLNSNKTNKVTSTTLLAAGTYTIYAFLTPNSSNYTSASQGASLTVNKLSPQFDYTITSSIVYGATVAQALSASSSVLGSILYYLDIANTQLISSTDVFDAGLYTIYAVFSPADNLNYESETTSASLTVDRKATSISFPNISSFVYETTLQSFVEGTTSVNSIAGSFNFYINNLSGASLSSSTVLSVGTYTIFCQFVPTDSTNYLTATKTKSLTVTKLGTSISFSPSIPSSINYGTTLSQILSTSVTPSVAGSVKFYKDAANTQEVVETTVLDYGSYTIYAVFTPTSGDYNTSSTLTTLSVTKISTTVTYPTLSNIVYGTTLASSFTASVSPSIQGAFNYYYKVGSTNISLSPSYVLNAGSYTIYVDFVPNSSSYLGSSSQQSLVVTALTTSVIYDTLPNIVYLTTLASSFNAVAFPNVSGSMKYYIDSLQVSPTKVLTPGSYTITAIFTPTSVNYSSSTTTKSLTVTKIPPAITFPNISTFVHGTTLENFLGSTVTDVSGTFEFFLNDANGTSLSSSTILDAGTYTIFSRFTPTDTTYHQVSTATKILTVTQIATSISYSPSIASSIVYETTLADILQTSVSEDLQGTTVYTVNGTVVTSSTLMNVGTHVITATFTPTDPDYAQSTATTSLTVTAASTSLSYSIPSTIVYGTTLNSSLIASCTKPGTIAYYYDSLYTSIATGTDVPDVGSYTLYAVFTPSTSNYLSSTASVNLTVSVQTTTLAFSPSVPSVITYETTLADIFSASVTPSAAGTISYYYMNGVSRVDLSVQDVLAIGNYTIQAEFTPASSNSGSSSTSTALMVTQKPIVVNFSGLSAITYGTSLASSLTATVSHPITGTLSYYTDSALNSEVTGSTVLNAGSYTIYAKFTPSSSNYVSYTVNTGLTVNKATPVVTYGFLPSIAYGTTLQSSFTASANIAGTIAYFLLNDPIVAAQMLNAGTYTLRAQFTPTNTTNYNSTFATSSLTVTKITPTVTMQSIAPITYETTLASFVSGTTASVPGTFSFYLADSTVVNSSTVLDVGNYTIYSSFVPTNTTNYNSMIMASASLQVLKKTTSITLSAISTLSAGSSMSSFISGTSASGQGTLNFYLSNASGQELTESSVLQSGSYTIYSKFTPTNPANYSSSSASKMITVQGGGQVSSSNKTFDVTKIIDNMSLWIDAKSSTKFDYDQGKQGWSDNLTRVATHVAVGSGTKNAIAFSYDGVSWNSVANIIFSTSGNCVATNGSIWIAGGAGTTYTLAYSFDGINWVGVPNAFTGITTRTNGIAYGKDGSNNGMWVALGTNGSAGVGATSYDGVNWTPRGTVFSSVGNAIAWNGSMWVAVGQTTNTIMTSTNGTTWTGLGTSIFSTAGFGIAWNGSMWVAVGQGTNTIAYSYNGSTWTGATSSPISTAGYGVAWNGSMWVAVGQGTNSIAYSYDGIAWTGVTGTTLFSTNGFSITWNGSQWIAGGVGTNTMATSPDGITWTARGNSTFSTNVTGIVGFKTTSEVTAVSQVSKNLITGAGTNSFGFMPNSSTFSALNRLTTFSTQGNAVFHDSVSGKWVAVGSGSGNTIATSNDGFTWTGRDTRTFAANNLYGIAYANSLWVACATGSNTIATSTDGITWTGRSNNVFTSWGLSAAYANNLWVAVGRGGNTIATSTDGITWTGRGATVFTTEGLSVAYRNGLWVAVGRGGNTIATSTDGITWTGRGATVFTTYSHGIEYANNLWVAVGMGGNTIATSTDGITWTGRGATIFTTVGQDLGYGNGLWVACGQGGNTIATSTDGITWTGRGAVVGTTNIYNVKYGNNLWVAVGEGGNTIASSTDGITWTGRGTTVFTNGFTIGYGNGIWVAGGTGGNTVATSTDGINWTPRDKTFFTTSGNDVINDGTQWIAAGSGGNNIAISSDGGVTWSGQSISYFDSVNSVNYAVPVSPTTSTTTYDANLNATTSTVSTPSYIATGSSKSLFVAVGDGTNTIATSTDGNTWTGRGNTVFTIAGDKVAYGNNLWVAVAYSGGPGNSIATSTDGITWTGRGNSIFSTSGKFVVYANNLWVAGGSGGNTIATSTDGITWTGLGRSVFTGYGFGFVYNDGLWVAVGEGGNTIASSTNGTSWTGRGASVFTTNGRCVAYNNGLWVAGGDGGNTLATSTNGTTWTGRGAAVITTSVFAVAYGNNLWVAVGQGGNSIATSTDGINWTGRGVSIFSTGGRSIAYTNGLWIAGGTGTTHTIATSSDGINWTGRGKTTLSTNAYGVAVNTISSTSLIVSTNATTWIPIGITPSGYGTGVFYLANYVYGISGSYVAVGYGGNSLARSDDGINWTGAGTSVFTTSGNGVFSNGTIWVAVGEGGNTIATSTDRITWTGRGATVFTTRGNKVVWNANLGLWIATGQGGNTVATSTDGITWTGRGTTMFSTAGYGIARSGPVSALTLGQGSVADKSTDNKLFFYVSVGSGGNTVSYSIDGKTWTGRGATVFTTKGNKIAHNGSMYVLVGQGGNTIAYSSEGVNITGLGATVFTSGGYGVAANSYMWVAVGQGGNTVATSTNGLTWTGRSSAFSTAGYNVAWANNQWIAVGEGGNTISTSTDGITWTGRDANVVFTKARGIAYGAGIWVAVGEGTTNTIATSTDGTTWTGLGKTTFSTAGNNVAWNGSRFVAVGQGGNSVATSTDGTTWSAVAGTTFATYGSDIKWCNTNWVAVGSDATNYYLSSVDGLTWTGLGKGTNTTEVTGVGGFAYTNKVKYLTCESGTNLSFSSFDGINWIRGTLPASSNNTVTYINNLWVGTSNAGITYSSDGISWTTVSPGFTCVYAAFGNGLWIVFGQSGQISTSPNLVTWTTRTSPLNGRCNATFWNGSLWIALATGTTTMARSSDGITWLGMGATTFTSSGNTVTFANNLWVAGGTGGNCIATSPDGITWTGRASGLTTTVKNIAWNGSLFVGASTNPAIITSPDGINWTSRGNPYPNASNTIVWSGSFWIATASNYIAFSNDGITWTARVSASVTAAMGVNPTIDYPIVTKAFDKSVLSNDSNIVVDDFRSNFPTGHQLKENLINGYPALQLLRSGFTTPYVPGYLGSTFSFFSVIKFNMMYGTPRFLSFGSGANDASSTSAFMVSGVQTSATNYSVSLWRNNVEFPISNVVLGTPYLISGYFTGSAVNVGINGVYTTFSCSGDLNIQRVGVGVNTFDNSGSTHHTDYGELMAFTSVPSAAQRQTMEGYLAQKWGLLGALPVSHPYSNYVDTVAPIYIPQSNNSGYAGRIIDSSPMSYYPIEETGSKIGNYSSLEKFHNNTFSGQPVYDANIIQDLSVYYNFNLDSKTDSSIANYATGAYVNDATLSTSGSISSSTYQFGTGSLVLSATSSLTLPSISVYPLGTTFSFWLKSNANANNSYVFVLRNNSDFNQQSIYLNILNNSYSLNVINSATSSSTATGSANINSNAWTHFVWTLDPAGNWRTYINNVLTDNLTGRLYPSLGSRNTNNLGSGAFTEAYLDEFMMFNRVLTASEVATLYEGTPIYLGTNPVVTSTSDKKFGTKSLSFPSTTHTGTVALNPVSFASGNAMTLSAWVKFASLDTVPRTILSLTNATDSIRLAATANNYLLYRGDVSFNVPVTPSLNTWTHVVANNASIGTNTWTVSVNKSANTTTFMKPLVTNLYVAAGSGDNTIATSTDRITWTGLGRTVFTSECRSIAYGNGIWVAVGSGGNTIATSTDGFSWTGRGSSVFQDFGWGIAYGNGLWVGLGRGGNSIATSTDGITWTGRGSSNFSGGAISAAYGNGLWVAVGASGFMAKSTDGSTWTTTAFGNVISSNALGVAYGNGTWVAVGMGGNSIARSSDGTTWTGYNSMIQTFYSVSFANNLFVAVGNYYDGFSIATSTDGITWTARNNTVFTTGGRGVTYKNGLWIAIGSGGNTVATSSDGITWTGMGSSAFTTTGYSIDYAQITSIIQVSSNTSNNVYTKSAIGMDASSNSMKMDGFIDDVRIFNSSLSKAQISQLYDGKVDPNSLVSHYTFDSVKGDNSTGYSLANFASGSVVYDASMTNVNLQTTVGKRLGVGCLSFPSTSFTGSVTLGNIDLRADPSNATFSTWVKFSSLDTVPRTVFSFGQSDRVISLSATYQNYTFSYRTASATRFINLPGTNLNTWNHVAVEVNNDVSNSWIFYLNGVKTSFTVDSSFTQALPTVDFANVYTSNYMGADVSFNKMHGFIDDTRVYNKGLTDSEVLNLFNTDYVFTVETVKSIIATDAVPTAILFSSIDSVVYGTTMAQFISQTTASADGTLSFFIDNAQGGSPITASTVLSAGSYTIFCVFTSDSPSDFLSTTSFKSFTVEKVPTTVTMSTISTIAYGTTMASFMNGTTTSVSGTKTFYINDTSGQLLASSTAITVGSVTIYCKFEPTDSNYASSFATKQLIVTQKQMTVTYGPLSAITYGTKLTSRLTASFSPVADGSMNYYVNSVLVTSSTVLDANTHTITATFSPASSNYLGASATASLVVNKAATVVTYPTLPSVFFNGPIGTGSLCATVIPDISGTMAYFTNSTFTNQVFATTTLAQGTYTLYARFTPLSTNYAVSSASSTLLVKGITTPTITFPNTTTVAAYTTLESFINSTSAGVAGTFVFRKNNSSGDILTATSTFNTLGNFVVFCSFAPTNTELYLPATASATVVVKFTPSFLFNQRPSSTITYGTNLSGTVLATTVGQFNNANIAGTVTFSNNLTTASILTPGIYTVTATFTPTSSNEYNTVTTTKQVLVTKHDIMIMITSPSVKSAFIKSTPIDCSYQVFGIISALGDTFQNSVSGTIVNKYMSFDESTVLTAQYVYNTTFSGSSQNYKIAADISGFSSTKYNLTSQSYTFTMNKYTPTISYAVSAGNKTITYGSKLTANQLNAVVTYNGVAVNTGSIVYTRSAINMAQTVDTQTALDIGQYNLYAYYSDPSGNMYNSVNTASITSNIITVVKATPVISFPNIKSILAGTDLNNILGFTVANFNSAIIDGTFVFSYVNQSGATVVLDTTSVLTRPPSSFTIDALFTPLDTARYNTATGSLTITVSDQLTTLTPTTLFESPITYGKNFNQLYSFSVSPSVAGTYTYYDDVYAFDPSSIIDVGTYTYTVIFNPTNAAYAASLVDLTFTIQNASLTLSYSTAPSFAFQTADQLSLLQPTKSVAVDGEMQVFLDSSYTTELTNSTVLAVGTHPLYVRFTPTKNYNVATATTTLTVTKIPTSFLYATQSSTVVYGTANSAFLNNVIRNSIPGTITYYYDNSYNVVANMADILDFGTRTIYTRFVPTDSNYAMAYATYTVNVIKNALTLVYPTLSSIQYGATLASSFTAYATFDGSVNYYINTVQVFDDTKLNGGTYNLTAKFTPTKPSNFTTSSISVSRTLIVSKQNTEVTYAPANIMSGNTFAASMTATVAPDVSGTLRYFNGTTEIFDTTVLPTGNYSINVTFTPTALTNYNSSSIIVPVTVLSNIQFTIMTENTQQMQVASNNQVVSLVTQNELLPPTLDVKVNVLPPGETSFVSTLTSSTVKKLQFDLVDGSVDSNIRIVAAPLTVNVPGASNSPAIFFKMYDETGNSILSKDKKVSLTLDLPQYKGLTQFLYLLRMQEVGTDFDGTKVPLTSVNPSDPQNTSFTALFSSNSVYVGAVVPPAPNVSEGVMVSNMYTFSANGGFVMQRGFDDIKLREETPVETYDVTDSVQILFDVATFNAKLGLIKNPTNTSVIISQFNAVTDQFEADSEPIDSITISSTEFKTGLVKAQQIISVGRYSSLYSDFKNYVSSYFGFDGGFSSLFVAASEFSIDNDNHFDSASMLSLLTGATSDGSGAYISDLSGSITVVNVTKSLRHAVNTNCFGNRSPTTGGTAVDPANISNYGVADGFVAGDLVWINAGTMVKLNLNIDTEGFNPVNNVGPQNSLTQITNYSSGNFSRQTTATTTNINRTVRAPLLLKLVDASTLSALQ